MVKRRNENKNKRTKRVRSHKRVKRSSKRNRRSFKKKNKRIKRTQKRKRVLRGGMEAAGYVPPAAHPIKLTIYCAENGHVKGDTGFKFMKNDVSPEGRVINGRENKYFTLVKGKKPFRFNFKDGWNHWAYAFDIVADYVITNKLKKDAKFEVNFVIEGTEVSVYKYELFFEVVKMIEGGVGTLVPSGITGIYRIVDGGEKAYLVEKKYEKQCVCPPGQEGEEVPLTEKLIYNHIPDSVLPNL